ncbi:hypothetical protein [Blastococcus sp. VKM Ac-2987]|uniref:hypothetical protein n=1 Tax=Blastococcus sp. VKM Ac-2987 TaxID=3004141 RepID=UPI0022AB972B|nr:hypothetical protein [Blastococcus sp. VKM Ac-2987]MCZ2858467.1 hypothetical protein [Blastococcus sp. VKM Ac-2987]
MSWVLIVIAVWVVVALGAALLIGGSIRLADRRAAEAVARLGERAAGAAATQSTVPRPAGAGDDRPWPDHRSAAAQAVPVPPQRLRRTTVHGCVTPVERIPSERQPGAA